MPIASPIGFLDVVNATLRASQVETTSRLTVANTAATKNFSVGDRFHVDKDSVDPVSVTGNVVASGIKISNLTISPIFDLGAVSNVGNTTSNTLQFANATTSFVASSNVEIGGNITLTSNAQVKVGSNVLAEYTGPHGREPKEMPIKKFPEIAFDASKLDGNYSTNTYTQAGYTVTVSSSAFEGDGFVPWKVFNQDNGKTGNNGWHTAGNPAAVSGSPYNTIDSSYVGEWLKIELPNAIKLSHVSIASRKGYASTQAPAKYRVYGSNNDSTWIELIDADNLVYTDEVFTTKFSTTTNYYKYLALVIQRATAPQGNFSCTIGEIQYYGYEEPAPSGDLSLDTTLKSTFNSVRSNNYVMYFDGEDPAAGNVPKYLPSGSAKSITPNNVVFDATNNCWTLNGSTESNVTTGSLGLVGDTPHTVSTWINASNLDANATTQQLFSIGSGYSEEIVRVDDTQIAANTWHNVTYAYQGEGGSKVTYVDGRKVEEAQVEDTFGDYPPFAMTGYKTGGYCVSASEAHLESVYRPFSAFNDGGTDINNVWHTPPSYTGTSSEYVGSVRLATNVDPGHWIKLETPHKLQVSYMTLVARPPVTNPNDLEPQAPKDFQVCGSNDDVNWDVLASFTGEAPQDDGTSKYTVNAQRGYKYLALAVNKGVNSTSVTIANISYYGHKEGDLTRFPEPTRVLKYPHVTMTGPGQRGYVVSTDDDNSAYPIWKVFDDNYWVNGAAEERWQPNTGVYASNGTDTTGGGTTTLADSSTKKGNYVQLESPHKLNVTKYKIYSSTVTSAFTPKKVILLGSNTGGSDWVSIDPAGEVEPTYSGTNADYAATVSFSNTSTYKYHRLVIRAIASQTLPVIYQLQLYGTQENTGTPAIVGGPFAGKVANFRVYDQYLGDERIQEIYDAQKDEFGHKKSSMTFYKGRIGVGTTEPEGALTVVDEPHAVAKFPSSNLSADYSFIEGEGCIKISSSGSSGGGGYGGGSSGAGFSAFDGLTSTSWTATPTRNTRLSEEVDFGAWLKIQTPESMSLKKAEIESKPDWMQVGSTIVGGAAGGLLGIACDCSRDGTRIIMGAYGADVGGTDTGSVRVYDWNGSAWSQVGNIISGTENGANAGYDVSISGDGNIIAVAEPYHDGGGASGDNRGVVSVYYLATQLGQWTILPDSSALTSVASGLVDKFVGSSASEVLGWRIILSGDGYTLAVSQRGYSTNAGRVSIYRYVNGGWTQKGGNIDGVESNDLMGQSLDMSEDGNHLIIGAHGGTNINTFVYDYNSNTNAWDKIGGSTLVGTSSSNFGISSAISNDGSVIAVGASGDDADGNDSGRVYMYKRSGSNWTLVSTLSNPSGATDELFGTSVSLSGDGTRLVSGASYYDPPGGGTGDAGHAGKLYTFEYDGASWRLRDLNSISATGLEAGVSDSTGGHLGQYQSMNISRDGSTIIGGEYLADITLANEGRVRVWNMPSNIKSIWGSNDDVNWTKITTGNEAFRGDDRLEFKNLDNPNYYKYHAIVADAFTQLKEVKLFGVRNQGSSTLHDGTLTLTKKVTAPQLESTGIINMKGDYTEIRANSNVVTCFDRSKKLIRYPRVALTSAALNSAYENGYRVTFSNEAASYRGYEAFDYTTDTVGWHSNSGTAGTPYNGSGGLYSGTARLAPETELGEWLGLELPEAIKLQSVRIASQSYSTASNTIKDFVIYAKKQSGNTWTNLGVFKNMDGAQSTPDGTTVNVGAMDYYKMFAIVATKRDSPGTDTGVSIRELEYFGFPEYDPEANGVDVTIKSIPNVPNTDWLEVYYDGQDYTQTPTTVTDKSGNNHTGTPNGGVGFDTEYKAFTFDGSNDGISTTSTATLSNHTASMWIKFEEFSGWAAAYAIRPASLDRNNAFLYANSDNRFRLEALGNTGPYKDFTYNFEYGKWIHLTVLFDHTGLRDSKIYVDNVELVPTGTVRSDTDDILITGTTTVYIGSEPGYYLYGSVANFRLFNRKLSTDEIYQLYAYQKEYFGHGNLGMTLKAGRLGLGISEPKEALDVRGSLRINSLYGAPGGTLDGLAGDPDFLRIRIDNTFSVGEAGGQQVPNNVMANGSAIIEYTGGQRGRDDEGSYMWLNGDTMGIMNTGDTNSLHWYDADVFPDASATRHWFISTSGAITNSSDLTLKNNIRYFDDEYDISNSMLNYSQIKFCKYNWKRELKDPSGVKEDFYGVIAQEIEPLFPEMIKTDEGGLKMIQQERLQYISYHMIANLIQKNAALEARILALENA